MSDPYGYQNQQNQGQYGYQPQQGYGGYQQGPPPPQYGDNQQQHQYGGNQYGDNQYNQQYGAPAHGGFQHGQHGGPESVQSEPPPQDPNNPYGHQQHQQSQYGPTDPAAGQEGDRGLMGAVAGGLGGGLLGNKAGHGIIGTIAGAFLGSKAEDKFKESRHDSQYQQQYGGGQQHHGHHGHHNQSGRAVCTAISAAPVHNAKYFFASPTYNKWVKLTAADVHALRQVPGFEGQNVYFHLNHPIRFVYLVAPVVAIQEIPNTKFLILTLDDSSGSCIDVKIERIDPANSNPDSPSNTTVANVDIDTPFNRNTEVKIDGQIVDIATVLKVKCTIGSFRSVKQLDLKRCNIIKDTTEEAAAWESLAQFKRDVLAKPWILDAAEQAALDAQLQQEAIKEQEEERRERRSQRAHQKREELRAERRQAREEVREQKRLADEQKFNQGALI
ncbi:unnamed protein product [Aureobasidium vineae]|uniref:CST complex subunit Stn1 N-terminal domain-containing protein n=1 Tax=Aureobasidium vineae TaxID=2773715 RepID=A0A9N8K4Q7_9PEZI|nr:unnamed protein product [Aureobasidium vineae]